MRCAACEHEQVPDAVRVGKAGVDHIEDYADRIEQSAGHEPGESMRPERMQKLEQRHQRHPAHHDVDQQGHYSRAVLQPQFLQAAEQPRDPTPRRTATSPRDRAA